MTVRPTFASGTQEDQAYQALLGLSGVSVSTINTGCHRVNYSGRSDGGSPGNSDREVNACEVWGSLATQAQRLPTQVSAVFGSQPPWILPSSPGTQLQPVLTRIDNEISRLRTLHRGTSDADVRVARGLYNFVFSTPGLGIAYTNSIQEHSAGEILLRSDANCSESFSVLKAVFQRAGLNVFPAFVFLPGGLENAHIATGFQYNGRTYLMDPSQRDPLNSSQDGFDASHSNWVKISLREFWAWQLNNRGEISAEAGNITQAEGLFSLAQRLDPNNPHFPNNLGVRLDRAGRAADAERAYRQAITADSSFVEPYGNLGALLIDRSRYREASVTLTQGLALDTHNHRILYNLALAQDGLGNRSRALSYVERAIGQDSSISAYFQLRGQLLNRLGRYTEARDAFAVASRLGPSD